MRDVNSYNRNQPQVNFYIIAFFRIEKRQNVSPNLWHKFCD